MQRASGGYGSFIINNRPIIPIPFDTPYDDIVILIGDWYKRNHTVSICYKVGFVQYLDCWVVCIVRCLMLVCFWNLGFEKGP